MTMLAMWLDETSVALATDSKMTGTDDEVTKLHCVHPHSVMFEIGFGEDAFEWLSHCSHYIEPHPEYWRDRSGARTLDELEQFIRDGLNAGGFPQNADLELWFAGVNAQDILQAFILNGVGDRVLELTPGSVTFNSTSRYVTSQHARILVGIPGIYLANLAWGLEERFWAILYQEENEEKGIEFSGAEALRDIGQQLIRFREMNEPLSIGG